MSDNIKIVIVSDDQLQAQDLSSRISQSFSQIMHIRPEEVRREISRLQPNIVLIHEHKDGSNMQLIPYIVREVAEAKIIYLIEKRDPIVTRDANRAGAFDVLFLPDEINALMDVLNRAVKLIHRDTNKEDISASFTWGRGQVIAFYSGKGGSGRSLLSSTLAQTLQLDSTAGVLLVDLNFQFGGIETILNIENTRNIYDLTPVLHELNDNHIRSVTKVEPFSQIEVLVSPSDAEIAEQLTEEHVERLLRTARLYYDYIIVDLPTEMTALSFAALEEADRIFYVMEPDATSVRILGRVLELFSKIGVDPDGRLEIILNKLTRFSEVSGKDVYQHFNYPVIGEIREDSKRIQYLLNRGKPIRSARRERGMPIIARDISKIANILIKQQTSKSVS